MKKHLIKFGETTLDILKMLLIVAAVGMTALALSGATIVRGQTLAVERMVPLGNCQLTAAQLAASIGLSACTRSAFTGTGSGTSLTASSVTGIILVGDAVTGTGVPAGTVISAQISGTTGGAGVYRTSIATTSSGASLVGGGIPPGATMAFLQADVANVRYRDDGGIPTTAIGNLVVSGSTMGLLYNATLTKLRFIAASGSPLLNIAFYR